MLIDTHCHVYSEYYDNIDDVMTNANKSNVKYINSNAVDLKTAKELVSLCNSYENMYISLGFHPEYASEFNESDLQIIEKNINNPKVVAIGEIGLDYHYDVYDKNKQKLLFCKQLDLAQKYNMPVIIHSRDALLDTLDILKKYRLKGIIHCFSGSTETAKEYIKLGYLLGIGGVVTFKNSHLIEVVRNVGINNIVLETDSPYLTPVPDRGKINQPLYVKNVCDFLESNLGIDKKIICEQTTKNAVSVLTKICI